VTKALLGSCEIVLTTVAILATIASCTVVAQAPNQESTVVVKLRVLKQDGPVQILGVRFPDESEKEPSVHLRNSSGQQTKAIWTEAIISNESGQVTRTNSNVPNVKWPAERSIEPGAEGWARETVLESSNLMMGAKKLHSNCLNVDIVIMAVDFDDGTSWHPSATGATLPEHVDDAETCGNATATQSQVDSLVGVSTISRRSPVRPPSSEVQTYSFACTLKTQSDKTIATCPF
jgi:hypothetical protein